MELVFGPVPSRRLGRSLGINNIPPKICSYDCVYCQLGGTVRKTVKRQAYYEPEEVFGQASEVVERLEGERVDFLTFVPDGEPTLDINLGKTAGMLKSLGKIAIITNSSLLWMEEVRQELLQFDFISVKLDAVSPELWKEIDRPAALSHRAILEGMLELRKNFKGRLVSETMLIGGVDYSGELERIADFLSELRPDTAYISAPTRPPSESWVSMPSEELLNRAYHIFSESVPVEFLISYEGGDFSASGDAEKDLLSITSVHPMRKDAVESLLERDGRGWNIVETLLESGKLVEIEHEGHTYYVRKLPLR